MIRQVTLLVVLISFCNLNIKGQGIDTLISYNQFSSSNIKVISPSNGNVILYGIYSDTIGTTSEYERYAYPYIATFPGNKFISLKLPQKYAVSYNSAPFYKSPILKIDDTTFCYFFIRQDTGQEYKKTETWLVWFNSKGDTIKTKRVNTNLNIGLKNILYIPTTKEYVIEASDSIYYGAGPMKYYRLIKLDSTGDIIWSKSLWKPNLYQYVNMLVTPDTNLLFIGKTYADYPPDPFAPFRQYYFFCKINRIDGSNPWAKVSKDSIPEGGEVDVKNAIRLTNGKFLLLGLPFNLEHYIDFNENWKATTDSSQLALFNTSFVLERKITISRSQNRLFHRFTKMLSLQNEGAVIYGETIDTLKDFGDPYEYGVFGNVVAKFDNKLNEKWRRHYQFDTTYHHSYIHDIVELDEGGFYLAGNSSKDFNIFTSWLIKTDSFGCIIPGCHLYDGVQEINPLNPESHLTLYPNPVHNKLNIKFNATRKTTLVDIVVVDSKGEIVINKKNQKPQEEIVLETEELSIGVYYILLLSNEKLIDSSKFIKN